MATATPVSPTSAGLAAFDTALSIVTPRLPKTHREFAREFVIMPPDGPRGNQRYRDEWQPVLGLLWDELDKEIWQEVVVTGPAQASKSFGALVVPTLRDIVTLGVSPIVGVPEADMFADKWDKDFKPVLSASPKLRPYMPTSGSGARDGRVRDMVTFNVNGKERSIKVMSRGGQATNKAGFTSQRLRITEAAGFSAASQSKANREADSYRQLLARLDSLDFKDPRRLVLIEGTGTVAEELPWRLRGDDDEDDVLISSKSRIVSPCPHCEAFISPEREHLVGWQAARSSLEAYDLAVFVCPECGESINDDQRRESMKDVRLVHHGQEITPKGDVIGDRPYVPRLFFRYSTWHNCLKNAGSIAVVEWDALQTEEGTEERENAERDLTQKKWAVPFKSKLADSEPLEARVIMRRKAKEQGWQRGVVPADTDKLVVGVDLGDWTGWWVVLAFRKNGQIHVVAYGAFTVIRTRDEDVESRLKEALTQFDETVIAEGFPVEGSDGAMIPDAVWVDMNYLPDTVAEFVRTRGRGWDGNRWKCCRGRGRSEQSLNNGSYHLPPNPGQNCLRHGTQWHAAWNYTRGVPEVTFDSDHWVTFYQNRLRSKVGVKGAISLFRADNPKEHSRFSSHLVADRFGKVFDPKKGRMVEAWKRHGDNHWGDGVKLACCGADSLGFKLRNIADPVPPAEPEPDFQPPSVIVTPESPNWYASMSR